MDKTNILMKIVNDPRLIVMDDYGGRFPALKNMIGFLQDSPYHKFSLVQHTIFVVKNIPEDYQITRIAALYHDCGKVDTQTFDPVKGHSTYHGHDKVGADLARIDLDGVLHPKIVDDVCLLISLHMRPLGYINQPFGNKGVRRLIRKAQGNIVDIDDLLILNYADILAHTPDQVNKSLEGHFKLKNHINSVR